MQKVCIARRHIPEGFLVVAVLIRDISIQTQRYLHLRRAGQHTDFHREMRQTALHDTEKAAESQLHAGIRQTDRILTGQEAVSHIQRHRKVLRLHCAEIDLRAVHRHADGGKIHGVDDLTEILRVAVFPPAHAGLVRKPHAGNIGALVVFAGVSLLKVAAHAHIAVTDGGKALHEQHILSIQRIGFQHPRIDGEDSIVHFVSLLAYVSP